VRRNELQPPAIVRRAEDLVALAETINAAHEAGEGAARKGLEQFRKAGDALLKAKALVGHGNFGLWLEENVTLTPQTARGYMRIASRWDEIEEAQNENGFPFGLCDALRLLTEDADEEGTPRAPRAYHPPGEGPATTDDAKEDEDDEDVEEPEEGEDEGDEPADQDEEDDEEPAPAPPRKRKTKKELRKRIARLKERGCEFPSRGDTLTLADLKPEVGDLTIYEFQELMSLWAAEVTVESLRSR
jgi:Protein of unknown function (DUF3102)